MFDILSEKFEDIFKKLRKRGKLNEKNIQDSLREVKRALLEADVHFRVVKDFIEEIRKRAVGSEVLQSMTPGQQVIKIVNEELCALMGGTESRIKIESKPPTILMMVGLQGSGKTTSAAKLAYRFKSDGHSPYLVPADVYRPAAIEQLKILGTQLKIQVYDSQAKQKPVKICKKALDEALRASCDMVIIDTAGRLHIDEQLMDELKEIKDAIHPTEILLVADAMTGQDAVNVAEKFHEKLDIDGVILTKMDGDARGGAALSIRAVTNKPIKFVGVGEKLDMLEKFHPERMASRILGMGDVLSLIEKAEKSFSMEQAEELQKKMFENAFTLHDFREQLKQIRSMGPLDHLMSMIPGIKKLKGFAPDEKEFVKVEAMINSMTPMERINHAIINGSRKKRIARGSGTSVQDVNKLLKQFVQTKKMMKNLTKMGKKGFPGGVLPF